MIRRHVVGTLACRPAFVIARRQAGGSSLIDPQSLFATIGMHSRFER
jgi:hypothetical protein